MLVSGLDGYLTVVTNTPTPLGAALGSLHPLPAILLLLIPLLAFTLGSRLAPDGAAAFGVHASATPRHPLLERLDPRGWRLSTQILWLTISGFLGLLARYYF